jgi:hypothetical protein
MHHRNRRFFSRERKGDYLAAVAAPRQVLQHTIPLALG